MNFLQSILDPAVNCFLPPNCFHQLLLPLIEARDYFLVTPFLVLDCLIIFHLLTFLNLFPLLTLLNLFLLLAFILTHHLFPLRLNLRLFC